MMNETQATIDCIKMKIDIQRQILAETTGMSNKDLLTYFNNVFMHSNDVKVNDVKESNTILNTVHTSVKR
jgi:hypothetical protein